MRTRTISDDELDALLTASSPYAEAGLPVVRREGGRSSKRLPMHPRGRGWVAPLISLAATLAIVAGVVQVGGLLQESPPVAAAPGAVDHARSAAYASWIAEAERNATSDFEREILADGILTGDEYAAAMDRFFGCLEGRGFPVTPTRHSNGLLTFGVMGVGSDAAVVDCAVGSSELIEPLYSEMVHNPENRPSARDAAHARCLVEAGVVDAPYTAEDWRADSVSVDFRVAVMEDPRSFACFNAP